MKARRRHKKNKRLTVGFLNYWWFSPYDTGIINAAIEYDVNLIIFSGNYATKFPESSNIFPPVHALANKDLLDGIILSYTSMENLKLPEFNRRIAGRFASIPAVNIGEDIPGIPSLLADNYKGGYEIIKHMIKTHNCRKIAYLRGPAGNRDAEVRFRAYTDALHDHNLQVDKKLVVECNFIESAAIDAIKKIIHKHGLAFDAIACGNDSLAYGVINGLKELGYKIPRDVAVTGFDGLNLNKYYHPHLTSVRQPFLEIAKKAFEMLMTLIHGKEVPLSVTMPSELVIRNSCGCTPPSIVREETFSLLTRENTDRQQKLAGDKEILPVKRIHANLVGQFDLSEREQESFSRWLKQFLNLINGYLAGHIHTSRLLYLFLEDFYDKKFKLHTERFWSHSLFVIEQELIRQITGNLIRIKIEILFQELHVVLREYFLEMDIFEFPLSFWSNSDLTFISHSLMTVTSLGALKESFISNLPLLKIKHCYIAEFTGKVKLKDRITFILPRRAESILAVRNQQEIKLSGDKRIFSTNEFIPGGLFPEERYTLTTMFLDIDENHAGYIIFGAGTAYSIDYGVLRSAISKAINHIYSLEELKRTKAMAEAANKAKSEFLANMSHEIRTPLNSILGFADLLLEDEQDTKRKDKLITINQAGKNLLAIINDILDFSKIEAEQLDFCFERISLPRLFSHLHSLFSVKAGKKNLSFTLKIDKSVPAYVTGDKQRISQVLINLLGNALKFTDKGSICLKSAYKGHTLIMEISDTGIGIPEDKLDTIFTPFRQIDSSFTRKYNGTGLGLTICKRLITGMGGEIFVTSKVNKGSTFVVKLPLDKCPAGSPEDTIYPETESTGELVAFIKNMLTPAGHTFKILVAEDDEMNRLLYDSILEKLMIDYQFATDGKNALEQLIKSRFDLLFLDIHMPLMDGVQTIRIIRNNQKLKDLYVIAVTAYALKGDNIKYMNAGCDDYLSKPINKNVLLNKIADRIKVKYKKTEFSRGKNSTGTISKQQAAGIHTVTQSLDKQSREKLVKIIAQLKSCGKIFSNKAIKYLADQLLVVSGEEPFKTLSQQLYLAAENYELALLDEIINDLEKMLAEKSIKVQ